MFSEWLIQELENREWKQADLCRRSGITKGSISNYINGRIPNKNELIKIAKALKIKPEKIFQVAGILPEETKQDAIAEEAAYIFEQLDQEEKENAIQHLRLTLKIQEKKKKGKGK